jgi:limonene-1,2-epoxide hydrolase
MTPEEIVGSMIAALERMDLAAALEFMAADVEYDNVPMGKAFGHEAITATLTPILQRSSAIEWIVHHQAASGDATAGVVMNERTDRFQFGDRWAEIAVAGLFVVRDGKITLWRDYFDLGAARAALA